MCRKVYDFLSEGRHLHGLYRCQHDRGSLAIGAQRILRVLLCCECGLVIAMRFTNVHVCIARIDARNCTRTNTNASTHACTHAHRRSLKHKNMSNMRSFTRAHMYAHLYICTCAHVMQVWDAKIDSSDIGDHGDVQHLREQMTESGVGKVCLAANELCWMTVSVRVGGGVGGREGGCVCLRVQICAQRD
jgi:hypothetical protein